MMIPPIATATPATDGSPVPGEGFEEAMAAALATQVQHQAPTQSPNQPPTTTPTPAALFAVPAGPAAAAVPTMAVATAPNTAPTPTAAGADHVIGHTAPHVGTEVANAAAERAIAGLRPGSAPNESHPALARILRAAGADTPVPAQIQEQTPLSTAASVGSPVAPSDNGDTGLPAPAVPNATSAATAVAAASAGSNAPAPASPATQNQTVMTTTDVAAPDTGRDVGFGTPGKPHAVGAERPEAGTVDAGAVTEAVPEPRQSTSLAERPVEPAQQRSPVEALRIADVTAPTDQAAPTSATTAPVTDAGHRVPSAMMQRVEEAIRHLENAPPPRSLTLTIDEQGMTRITISLLADGVRLSVPEGAQTSSALVNDLEQALSSRGFDLSKDGRPRDDQQQPDEADMFQPTAPSRRPAETGVRL
jgi:hypothetical protein